MPEVPSPVYEMFPPAISQMPVPVVPVAVAAAVTEQRYHPFPIGVIEEAPFNVVVLPVERLNVASPGNVDCVDARIRNSLRPAAFAKKEIVYVVPLVYVNPFVITCVFETELSSTSLSAAVVPFGANSTLVVTLALAVLHVVEKSSD